MSYQVYNNLHNPNEVLEVMSTYLASRGYTIIADCVDDLNIYDQASSDGKKLVVRSRNSQYFYLFRSANGKNIFGTTNENAMASSNSQDSPTISGIGVTISDGYSPVARWYNQGGVPLNYRGIQVLGGFMPVAVYDELGDPLNYTYSLFCNNITSGQADTIVFTVMKENDTFRQCAHIVLGQLSPYTSWTGGAFFSASAERTMLATCGQCFLHDYKGSDQYILPVLSSGQRSNTFLRIDIDAAPTSARGFILWASSGSDNITGKRLSLPIRTGSGNGQIPNYEILQSKESLDWGRNINTLNCLTINLPIYFAVQVDPDGLNVYGSVGQVLGVYFVCTLNMQTSGVYRLNYPSNTDICQIFPMGMRRGQYGFDGISIKQELNTDGTIPLINFDYMERVATNPPVLNINNTTSGIKAYGGDNTFSDPALTGSVILLTGSYRLYSRIDVHYTNDAGDNEYVASWTRSEFFNAMTGISPFDITKGQTTGIHWNINPSASTTTKLVSSGQNCGIITITGSL